MGAQIYLVPEKRCPWGRPLNAQKDAATSGSAKGKTRVLAVLLVSRDAKQISIPQHDKE
jgi:hypothetical protein